MTDTIICKKCKAKNTLLPFRDGGSELCGFKCSNCGYKYKRFER